MSCNNITTRLVGFTRFHTYTASNPESDKLTRARHTNTDLPIIIAAGSTVSSNHTARNVNAGKNKQNANTKNSRTELATVYSPNFQLNTQSLNFPLLTNVSSSRLILRILLWLLLLLLSNNTTTNISSSTLGTTIHNRLVETERHQGETREYSSLLWGQARHKGLAFTRYPFVSQQLALPKPLYLPKMKGPTLILAQSGARWEFPLHQPQPVGLVPTVSFARADSSNS